MGTVLVIIYVVWFWVPIINSKRLWGGRGEIPPNNCFDVSLSEQSILLTPLPANCLLP